MFHRMHKVLLPGNFLSQFSSFQFKACPDISKNTLSFETIGAYDDSYIFSHLEESVLKWTVWAEPVELEGWICNKLLLVAKVWG